MRNLFVRISVLILPPTLVSCRSQTANTVIVHVSEDEVFGPAVY